MIYETLKQIVDEENKRKAKYIFLDETDGKIKEKPLSDMAGSALINNTVKVRNPAKLIHDFMFGN
jgi:hypothetical protein